MKTSSIAKRMCGLLLVLGTFGIALGTSPPADAQTPPGTVTWWQKNRVVALRGNIGTCWDIRVSGETSLPVPRGEWRDVQQSWFTCGNGTTTIVGHLITGAEFRADGRTQAQYRMVLRVDDPSGTVWCDQAVFANSLINRQVTQPFRKFWSQLGVESARSDQPDPFRYTNCGRHGRVGAHFRFEEGLEAA